MGAREIHSTQNVLNSTINGIRMVEQNSINKLDQQNTVLQTLETSINHIYSEVQKQNTHYQKLKDRINELSDKVKIIRQLKEETVSTPTPNITTNAIMDMWLID